VSEQGAHHQESRRRYRIGGRTTASDLGSGLGGHVDDLVAGYALGALDTAEREAVEQLVEREACGPPRPPEQPARYRNTE